MPGVRDVNLRMTLEFGIGLHHAGLHESDRVLVERLYVEQKIQVLVATATLAWGVNYPAHLVIVKGTLTNTLQLLPHGIALILYQTSVFYMYCIHTIF